MSKTVPVVATAVVAVLAGVVYTSVRNSNSERDALKLIENNASVDELVSPAQESAVIGHDAIFEVEDSAESTLSFTPDTTPAEVLTKSSIESRGIEHQTEALEFAQSVGREYVTDEALLKDVEALKNDPALLSAVVDEFLAETDEERLGRLRLLLGQLDNPSLVSAAESMVFSGNAASADAGLDLLRDISADVPAARLVALDVLSSTQNPDLLVGATQVMASGKAKDPEVVQQVVSSMSSLVQHPDARVRRGSYSTLARWSDDPSITPTLIQGLNDDDPAVRKSTAYGFVGYKHVDASVIDALLQTAENTQDTKRTRRGAILALKGMSLDDSQSARLLGVQSNIN